MAILRFLQINTGRKKTAHDLLYKTAEEWNVDILLMSETNKKMGGELVDKKKDTEIKIMNKNLKIKKHGQGNGFNWIEIDDIMIFNCYVYPNVPDTDLEQLLDDIASISKGGNRSYAGTSTQSRPCGMRNAPTKEEE
ncbi:hypothetical protein HHI36_009419 [Cryptolaemus montrouzieri]|uniref:Uncharacterized protein n=1 Tax=Cryptolaemus montrouzieri TaxID=559131 RepID=A0ABD2MVF2_9CUCU